jgi:arylsulfatase
MDRDDDVPREVLPIPDRKPVSLTTYDAKDPDTKFPPIRPLRPPAGAPNVLIILLDDVGLAPRAHSAGRVRHRMRSASRRAA